MFRRIEIKNLGGGKHQLVFNKVEMTDEGEITCESGNLSSSCQLLVKKGEGKPIPDFPDEVEGPISKPIIFDIPYKSECRLKTLLQSSRFEEIYR